MEINQKGSCIIILARADIILGNTKLNNARQHNTTSFKQWQLIL